MYGTTQWIIPLGIYHRLRSAFGLQYCPACLDRYSYFRKSWRLANIALCSEHLTELRDRCYHCGSPILLHRSEQGSRGQFDATPRFRCFSCGRDLRRGAIRHIAWNARVAVFQRRLEAALNDGSIIIEGSPIYSHLFLAGLRVIVQKLATGRHANQFRETACRDAGVEFFRPHWDVLAPSIEYLAVHDRLRLLLLAAHLLEAWPATFVRVARKAKITASALLNYDLDLPFWYANTVRQELSAGQYVPNEAEIETAMAFLEKRGVPITRGAVGDLLGNRDWHRKRTLTARIRHALVY